MHQNIFLLGFTISAAVCSASSGLRGRNLMPRFKVDDDLEYIYARELALARRGLRVRAFEELDHIKIAEAEASGKGSKPSPRPASPPLAANSQPQSSQGHSARLGTQSKSSAGVVPPADTPKGRGSHEPPVNEMGTLPEDFAPSAASAAGWT